MDDTLEDAKQTYVAAIDKTGDRHAACREAGVTMEVAKAWLARDIQFRGAVNQAWEFNRARKTRIVRDRIVEVVTCGAPQIQVHQGQVQYEPERHDCGQIILVPQIDRHGEPILDAKGRPAALVPKLRIGPDGNPVPIVVRKYAEATTIKVAESLGLFVGSDDGDAQAANAHMTMIGSDGKEVSISEMIKARFQAVRELPQKV